MKLDVNKLNKEVREVREAFAKLHAKNGCFYGAGKDKKDYVFHLDGVALELIRRIKLFPKEIRNELLKVAYGHDSLEDCNISPNDMIKIVGNKFINPLYGKGLAATIIFCVTDELGWDRKERADRTLPKIKQLDLAIAFKICDRISNMRFSKERKDAGKKDTMYDKYCEEFANFKKELYHEDFMYMPLWEDLAELSGQSLEMPKKVSWFKNILNKIPFPGK